MRRQVGSVAVILLSVVCLASVASASGPMTFGLGGGITMPTNGTGDVLSNGFHIRGLAELHLPALPVGLRGAVGYQKMNLKDAAALASGFSSGQSQILSGLAGVTVPLMSTGPVRPYITANLGAFHMEGTADSTGTTISKSQTRFGIDGGMGVKLGLGKAQGFVEARVENVYTDQGWNPAVSNIKNARFIPVTFGLNF